MPMFCAWEEKRDQYDCRVEKTTDYSIHNSNYCASRVLSHQTPLHARQQTRPAAAAIVFTVVLSMCEITRITGRAAMAKTTRSRELPK